MLGLLEPLPKVLSAILLAERIPPRWRARSYLIPNKAQCRNLGLSADCLFISNQSAPSLVVGC